MVYWIKIYPLQEKYKPVEEIESGIYKKMESKFIDKIRIKFRGVKKLRIIPLKHYGEMQPNGQIMFIESMTLYPGRFPLKGKRRKK